jgi:hypothetical protein
MCRISINGIIAGTHRCLYAGPCYDCARSAQAGRPWTDTWIAVGRRHGSKENASPILMNCFSPHLWRRVVLPTLPPGKGFQSGGHPRTPKRGGRPHLQPPRSILRLAALAAAALLLAGCGISLGSGTSSELFSKLSLEGEAVAGGEITLVVTHEQRYPLPVDISCFLVEPGHSRRLLGRDTLPADPDTSVEPTPVAGSSTFRFRVERPGRYAALCNTPLDPENFISKEFRVK